MTIEKVFYLIPHLGVPSNSHPPSNRHIIESDMAAESMGIKVLRIGIDAGQKHFPNQRYFFRFPNYRRDDKTAIRIAECFHYGVSVASGPLAKSNIPDWLFQIDAHALKAREEVNLDELVDNAQSVSGVTPLFETPRSMLSAALFIVDDRVAAAWMIARILFLHTEMHKAAMFFDASQQSFFVYPGDISEVASLTDQFSESSWEQIKLEDALLSSFKTIEAIIGDPPKSDLKFHARLKAFGIDPEEVVGYGSKKAIAQVIREMNVARDKKSAHGATPDRAIAIADVLEYQACARLILVLSIEKHLGEAIM